MPQILHPSQRLDSVVYADVTAHSRKPEIFTERIEQVHDAPFVELFARRNRKGWDTWGNENE